MFGATQFGSVFVSGREGTDGMVAGVSIRHQPVRTASGCRARLVGDAGIQMTGQPAEYRIANLWY
jgi:hypothetical protein